MPCAKPKPKIPTSSTTEKKLLTWHSTYGDIHVAGPCLRAGRRGRQVRPFCQRAGLAQRGYSLPLQRALVDFGADESFLAATRKMREHYGVELPVSGARRPTLAHAKASGALEHRPAPPARTLITAMDGSMTEPVGQEPAPVRGAHQYLQKRRNHLDYAGAKAAGLPIGSGEVESGHRHVLQRRLKVAGAWWTLQNAEAMLQLRTTRSNQDWNRYWMELAKN